jgi:hypothetical protein
VASDSGAVVASAVGGAAGAVQADRKITMQTVRINKGLQERFCIMYLSSMSGTILANSDSCDKAPRQPDANKPGIYRVSAIVWG